MKSNEYLVIVTNQIRTVSRCGNDIIGNEPQYVTYKVDGAQSLEDLTWYSIGGKVFLNLNNSVDIPLSVVTKACRGSKKADAEYVQKSNLF